MKFAEMEHHQIHLHDVKNELRQYVYNRSLEAFARGDAERDRLSSEAALEERRLIMRRTLIESLGGLPPMDTPLHACTTGSVFLDKFRIDQVVFESRPGHRVTANLYIPHDVDAPRGAVLFLCGHHDLGKHHPEYQTVCQLLALAGLVVLAMDPIGQGERLSYVDPLSGEVLVKPSTSEHEYIGKQLWPLGQGLARYFLHDILRAMDYLCTRPEVDVGRIGVTGNSGGGMQTSLAMLCDDRVAAAAPATFLMSRESYIFAGQAQDAEQIWPGMTAAGFDHEDILLALAPRPVLVLAVQDDFFPIEGTRSTVERARRAWTVFGREADLELFEDASTHRYTVHLATQAAAFFAKHLLGARRIVNPAEVRVVEPERLWCTKNGNVLVQAAGRRTVYDENVAMLEQLESNRGKLPPPVRVRRCREWLRERIIADRKLPDLNPRYSDLFAVEDMKVQTVLWRSQEGLFNHAFVFRHRSLSDQPADVTIGLWDGGTSRIASRSNWVRQVCGSGRIAMALNVTGMGPLTPNPINGRDLYENFGTLHKLDMDLLWLGDSLAAIRTLDVMRAVEMASCLRGASSADTELHAWGRSAMYARMAAMLEPRISRLHVLDEPATAGEWIRAKHYDDYDAAGYILPGMLAYFDWDELDGWISQHQMGRCSSDTDR